VLENEKNGPRDVCQLVMQVQIQMALFCFMVLP